ncbi:MAG TPA: 4'-phosphopantetheinyl transferase superfamily protein, partial [Gammaproteobacteria bacterium]|nr:4'-phosphopantetheinyl transferase superfamily protein [Gammaproteobacteria bacterium]
MTAAANAVHIYYADGRAFTEEVAATLVTAEDRLRLDAPMQPRRRTEYLLGRTLLRHALGRVTGRAAASFRIRVLPDGKPECVGGPAISLSHSGELAICAVAEHGAVGVDVETRRPRADLGVIAERYFTPAEARWIAADPDARFRMLWVLKEAYLKALGSGLAGGLATLECRIEPPAIVARVAGGGAEPRLTLWSGQGCYVGLAVTD